MPEAISLHIQKPTIIHLPVCQMMLPQLAGHPYPFEYRLAVDRTGGAIAGAIAFADSGQLHLLQMHIAPVYQGRDVGIQLIDYLAAEASCRGYAKVTARVSPSGHEALHAFLRGCGFGIRERIYTAEADVADIYGRPYFRSINLPAAPALDGWRVVPLSAGMLKQAERLYTEYLAGLGAAPGICRFVPTHLVDLGLSRALMVGDTMQGVVLIIRKGATVEVEIRVVRPPFRKTRAGAALILQSLKACAEAGAQRLRFSYLDSADDTVALVRRRNLKIIEVSDLLSKAVHPMSQPI